MITVARRGRSLRFSYEPCTISGWWNEHSPFFSSIGTGLNAARLFLGQHGLDFVHVAGESGDREQSPPMAAGDIPEAAVLARRVVEPDPAGQVLHRLGAGPIRVVLMPGDDPAVVRRLGEKLVVPEADAAVEQLRRGLQEGGMPQDVVEARVDAPRPERVEQDVATLARFIGVELVEEVVARMGGVHHSRELVPENVDLRVGRMRTPER